MSVALWRGAYLRRPMVRCWAAVVGCLCLGSAEVSAEDGVAAVEKASYHGALQARGLGSHLVLTARGLEDSLEQAHRWAVDGQRDRAIAALTRITQQPGFERFQSLPVGRATLLSLARLFAEAGAQGAAIEVLQRTTSSAGGGADPGMVSQLVALALASPEPEQFRETIESLVATTGATSDGELSYYRGRLLEREGAVAKALTEYGKVQPRSAHWAQAQYRIGLLAVRRGNRPHGEKAFCRVAAPRQTPTLAAVYGGGDFFTVRDLARIALGRVAHEDFRFEDASYYYHLVPADSPLLPEALYEAATSAYEAKNYERASLLLEQLKGVDGLHPYVDEALILEAYVALARCRFRQAEALLVGFLERYQGVARAIEQLVEHPELLEGLVASRQARPAEQAFVPEVPDLVVELLRTDQDYQQASMRLAQLRRQLRSLAVATDVVRDAMVIARDDQAVVARPDALSLWTSSDRVAALMRGMASVQRDVVDLENRGLSKSEANDVRAQLSTLQQEVSHFELGRATRSQPTEAGDPPLVGLLRSDEAEARELRRVGEELEREVRERRTRLAQSALGRFHLRLTRLARQAQAARVEAVLGTKRNLEQEIEALSDGLLPPGAVDSIEAARFMGDDEEFWPFDGEDWSDEYVGGEGL